MGRTLEFDRFVRLLQEARRRNLEAQGEPPPLTREQARWTRRRFMRATVAAGGAALAASAFPRLSATAGASHPRVVVVGGGIAGLNAAWQLKKAGVEATVFEARRRVGGRMLSVEGAVGDGLITDLGGSFIDSDHEDMHGLAEELGVEIFNRLEDASQSPFPGTAFYFGGRRREEEEVA
jgi:monoamine oxidase